MQEKALVLKIKNLRNPRRCRANLYSPLAEAYGATVILHTDHCAKKLLPWIDGLLDASERTLQTYGKSLFSSHMLDLSEEPIEETRTVLLNISKEWLKWA